MDVSQLRVRITPQQLCLDCALRVQQKEKREHSTVRERSQTLKSLGRNDLGCMGKTLRGSSLMIFASLCQRDRISFLVVYVERGH